MWPFTGHQALKGYLSFNVVLTHSPSAELMLELKTLQTFQKKVHFVNVGMFHGLIVVLATKLKVKLWEKPDFLSTWRSSGPTDPL